MFQVLTNSAARSNRRTAHRWRSSHAPATVQPRFSHGSADDDQRMLFDPGVGLAVCGDWLAGGRVAGHSFQMSELLTQFATLRA